MAKCPICTSRKGKRKCSAEGTLICSFCCGQTRNLERCRNCSFFQNGSGNRKYRLVLYYQVEEMAGSAELQNIAYIIESMLCDFDLEMDGNLTDKQAAQLLELAFDRYHFKDTEVSFPDDQLRNLFARMAKIIELNLRNIPEPELVKVLAAIYRSIQRRTEGGREYLQFNQQYASTGLFD